MKTYFIIFLLVLSCGFVKASSDTTSVILIEEVVVTTQRNPEKLLLTPYGVSLLDRKEMDQYSKRTTPEMLMNTGGVFVQKTNHGGGSPFIRGLTGNQTLLLLDGIRLNNSVYRYGPNQYLNTVDVFSIDRMEVAKGTGSVQYGSDALGGALQIFTISPEFDREKSTWHGKATGKFMTGDMEKTGRGQLQYNGKKVAFLAGGTYRDFGDLVGGKETGVQTPSGYKEYAFDGKLLFALNQNTDLTLASQFLGQSNVPIYHKVVLEDYKINEFNPQQRQLHYARLNIKNESNVFRQVKFTASWQQNVENTDTQKNSSSFMQNDSNRVNTLGFVAEISSNFSEIWTANTGVEVYHDKVFSSRFVSDTENTVAPEQKRGLYPDGSEYSSFSVYSLHHFSLGKWAVDGGVRFNAFGIKIKDENLGDVKISPEAVVFNLATMYSFNSVNHIYGTFSNGFRAPNIDDLGSLGIVDFRYEVPAYDLKPEKSANFEAGYKFSSRKVKANFSGYYMKLNQLITRVKVDGEEIDGYQVYKKENVDEAYITGCEAAVLWQVLNDFELNGAISYTYGQSITKDEPLRRIPPFNGKVAAVYAPSKWFVSGELLFAAKQDRLSGGDVDDNRIPDGGTPGWKVVNMFGGYNLSFVELKLGLENLFNEDYRTHGSGINGVGRSAWLMATLKF